jgi:NAD(P)H-hydrate epimerase
VVAGKGNNGGDGLVMARLLRQRGARVEVALLGHSADIAGDAAQNLRVYRRGRGPLVEITTAAEISRLTDRLAHADLVIDAIFGTGLNSVVHGLYAEAIELINACGAPVFAVDIASGLNADTGQPMGTSVQAEATATFGFAKLGQALFPGARLTGTLAVVDIGIAAAALEECPTRAELLDPGHVARFIPDRRPDAHKGDCGHLLVIAGGFGKTGAAQLATRGALRAGAGLVTLVGPASLYPIYAVGVVEAMTDVLPDVEGRIRFDEALLRSLLEGKTAVVVGPGIGVDDETRKLVRWLVQCAAVPVVLDADALNGLAGDTGILGSAAGSLLLTPHPGEMARLAGMSTSAVQGDRVGSARRFASEHRCLLILKGARTVVADSTGSVWINPTGNPGMAAGGMGDVLSGILGGLLAQGVAPTEAARLGVYVHGASADQLANKFGDIGLLASDVAAGVPSELQALREHRND